MLTEQQEQEQFIRWLELNKIAYFSSPASFFTGKRDGRFYGMLKKLKLAGFSSGFPDVQVFLMGKTIYIEMKRLKGGKLSDEQRAWHKKLSHLANDVYVCKGFDEAKICVEQFL